MIIEKVDPVRESFSDYSLAGTVLTIGGIAVDLAAEQGDQEVVITFSEHGGMIHRGMMPASAYIADVIIPPRKYDQVESDGEGGEADEVPESETENVPAALDLDSVVLRLWPVRHEHNEEGDR
jgi:hypothetical protein